MHHQRPSEKRSGFLRCHQRGSGRHRSQLRNTTGVEVAIFLYETAIQEFKVSLRSNGRVDVSRVASYFGGGGHVRAAGCTMQGIVYDVLNNLTLHIEKQLKGADL